MKTQISCAQPDWTGALQRALAQKTSVQLSDLDYTKNGATCERLAMQYKAVFTFEARQGRGVFLHPRPALDDGPEKR